MYETKDIPEYSWRQLEINKGIMADKKYLESKTTCFEVLLFFDGRWPLAVSMEPFNIEKQ